MISPRIPEFLSLALHCSIYLDEHLFSSGNGDLSSFCGGTVELIWVDQQVKGSNKYL
jgi:hypothetical protein